MKLSQVLIERRASLCLAGVLASIGAMSTVAVADHIVVPGDGVNVVCNDAGYPYITVDARFVNAGANRYVAPYLTNEYGTISDTDYNNQWFSIDSMSVREGGFDVSFTWTYQTHTDFIPGWYGPSNQSGNLVMDVWVDDAQPGAYAHDVSLSDNSYVNTVLSWFDLQNYAAAMINANIYASIGNGSDVRSLFAYSVSDYLTSNYDIDQDLADQILEDFVDSQLWVRFHSDGVHAGISNWSPPSNLSDFDQDTWQKVVNAMCG